MPVRRKPNAKVNKRPRTGNWKQHELKTARAFGTERVPQSGALTSLGTHSDTFQKKLYLECKYKIRHTIYDLYVKHKNKNGKKPLAIYVHVTGYRRPLVLIHSADIHRKFPNDFHIVQHMAKRIAVYSLYIDTAKKAAVENKTPCLSLRQKYLRGFLLGFLIQHYSIIVEQYGTTNNQQT